MTKTPKDPSRRALLKTGLPGTTIAAVSVAPPLRPLSASVRDLSAPAAPAGVSTFELDEITIAELQAGLTAGKYTSRSIAEKYLTRIDQIDKQGPAINAVIEINPDALSIAETLDNERKGKGLRGPLHGIPV